jgi:hypothetical protein
MITAKLWMKDEPTLINKSVIEFVQRKLTVMNKMGIRFSCKIIKAKDEPHLKYKGIKSFPVCIINSQRLYQDDIPRGLTNIIQKHRQKLMAEHKAKTMTPEEQMHEYNLSIITDANGWGDDEDNGSEAMSDGSVRDRLTQFNNARNTTLSNLHGKLGNLPTPAYGASSYQMSASENRRPNNIAPPSTGDDIKDAALATGNSDDLMVASMFESTDDRPTIQRTKIVRNQMNYRPC